ncbi:hypothetical protein [Thermococcus henrietii]|uniref:hypothetical protein n=1 Tax=Thermococcus henrietii TaxID=2016361 RepID=UPI000C06BE66|nr:hypothetical protein [Thermococcus henrietii]
MEDVVAIVPAVEVKPAMSKKKTRQISVMVPVEQEAFISQMSLLLGVRKGAVVMLAIALLQKFEEKNRTQLIEISRSYKRRAEVRKLFARFGIELKDKDFLV